MHVLVYIRTLTWFGRATGEARFRALWLLRRMNFAAFKQLPPTLNMSPFQTIAFLLGKPKANVAWLASEVYTVQQLVA